MEIKIALDYKQLQNLCGFLSGEENILPPSDTSSYDRFAKLIEVTQNCGDLYATIKCQVNYRPQHSKDSEQVPAKYLERLTAALMVFPEDEGEHNPSE